MSIFSHSVKNFPFDKLYKAVQVALKVEDDVFKLAVGAIKKVNEPAIKKLLEKYAKEQHPYKMEATIDGSSYFVRILDEHGKKVDKTDTYLIKDPKSLVKASLETLAEKKGRTCARGARGRGPPNQADPGAP